MPAAGPQNTRKRQLKKRRVRAPAGDVASGGGYGLKAAKKEKATPRYRQASQEAYSAAPTARKRKILKAGGTEGAEARKVHKARVRRNAAIVTGQAGKDTKSSLELGRGADERDKNVREARLKYLRRTSKPTVSLKDELEGKGLLAAGLHGLGDVLEERVAKGGAKIPGLVSHASSSGLDPNLVTKGLKDAVELPAQVLPSVYVPVAGGYEAAKGRPQRIKKFASDLDKHDPVLNTVVAGFDAATGDSASAEKRIKAAGKAAQDHPGFALAEVGGLKGVAGRGAGRVLRTGVAGKTAKQIASTTREPLALEGTAIKVHREYSPDLITKGRQVLQEHHGTEAKRNPTVTRKDLQLRVDDRVGATGLDPHPFVGEFAARTPNGKQVRLFTPAHAAEAAAEMQKRTGHEFVAQNAGAHTETGFAAFDKAHKVIVPKDALDRFIEHSRSPLGKTALSKGLGVANDAFRQTVLATSTPWAFGNVAEATIRAALVKAGPRSLVTGHRAMKRLKEIDPVAADELAKRVTGGGHYSLAEAGQIKDIASQFAGTSLEPLANALHTVRTTPGPKQVADLWHAWTKSVFGGTKIVERQFQKAMLGAEIRRSPLMDGHMLKLSKEAVDQAAQGLRDTNQQVHFARAVERAYGKYGAMSPSMKQAVALYTPFAAWSLNAVKFVVDTLPKDHPAAVGLTAAAENATAEWRKSHGLSLWMKGSVPGWLQGSIPGKGGKKYRISRFTPFGAFGDIGGTLSGQVLPLESGPLLALKGLTWNGQQLNHGGGAEGDKQVKNALVSVGEFLDATIPVVSQAKRAHEKGIEAFNPLAPVGPQKKKIRKRKSTSTAVKWDDGSSGVKWDDGSGKTGFFPK